ncbi:MAG TPA: hypothetical protein VK806_13015 [Bacteroidia bacterium]|jgi:hypothetical protein|nr:hypothetical protein [Bacteroidia bacterium]
MITPTEYNKLPINERANILWDKGTYLETWHDHGNLKVVLYAIEEVFIEIYYLDGNEGIIEIKAWHQMPMIGRVIEGIFQN